MSPYLIPLVKLGREQKGVNARLRVSDRRSFSAQGILSSRWEQRCGDGDGDGGITTSNIGETRSIHVHAPRNTHRQQLLSSHGPEDNLLFSYCCLPYSSGCDFLELPIKTNPDRTAGRNYLTMAEESQTRSDVNQGTASSQEPSGNATGAGDAATAQAPLPAHWEELVSRDGRTYYANHAARITAWQISDTETGEDGANTQPGLPAAWQAMVDSEGRTYYVNHESRTTTFDRPEGLTGELPGGWELLRTPQGVGYFADHNTRTVTWSDPRSA